MKYAYLDSSIWIACAEGIPVYRDIVQIELKSLGDNGWQLCFSDLVILEVLLKPYRMNRNDIIIRYNKVFSEAIRFTAFDTVFIDALLCAQRDNLKAIDATHIAFAVKYGCELFVTTDPDFRTLQSLPLHFIDLSQIAIK
ncbi:MAG: PIN domain-containing protein [Candidatus Omnitrophota bacterium]